MPGDTAEAAGRPGEHESVDAVRVPEDELLSDAAAEGDAEHVDPRQAEHVEQARRLAGEAGHAARQQPRRRLAGAGRVVPDGLDAAALSSSSSGSHISRLPPRPMISSSGRPSPRTDTRKRSPSTRAKVRRRFTSGGRSARARLQRRVGLVAELSGAGRRGPDRFASHANQWSHHEPRWFTARAFHSPASPARARLRGGAVQYDALALPGGLRMAWMCPLEASTNTLLPPSSWVVR